MSQDAGKSTNGKRKLVWAIIGFIAGVSVAALLVIAFVPGINAFSVYPAAMQAVVPSSSASPVSTASPGSGGLVAVFLPTKTLTRWSYDTTPFKRQLQAMGYTVDVYYGGENDVATQLDQIEKEIAKKPSVMVIEPTDPSSLGPVLEKAIATGIKVISYRKLIVGTPDVDYYAVFDYYQAGVIQGRYIESALALKTAPGPFHIELFAGSPDFEMAHQLWDGAMSILQPYIDSGKLVVPSEQKYFESVAIQSWKSESAQKRMDELIADNYKNAQLDAILSPNDSIAIGVIAALNEHGFGSPGKPWPILTGKDCDKASVRAIIAGKQSMSVFEDKRVLEARVVEMVDALMQGKDVPVNDMVSYNNGVKVVPTLLCDPVAVDKTNYKEALIESNFYTEADIQ